MKKIKSEGWKFLGDNSVLIRKGYYISFNSNTSASKSGLGSFYNTLGGLVGGLAGIELETDGRAETALVVESDSNPRKKFFILNGDFRKQYSKLKTLKECVAFYNANKAKHGSNWSDK